MTIDADKILTGLNVQRGAEPMTQAQFQRRIEAYTRSIWPWPIREQNVPDYKAWKEAMAPVLAEANAAFHFNHQLAGYRAALARLSQMALSEGREEVVKTVQADPDDPNAGAVEVIIPAIDPAPATVTRTGEDGNPYEVENPAIAADEAERAAAQATIDETPQEVIDYAEAG